MRSRRQQSYPTSVTHRGLAGPSDDTQAGEKRVPGRTRGTSSAVADILFAVNADSRASDTSRANLVLALFVAASVRRNENSGLGVDSQTVLRSAGGGPLCWHILALRRTQLSQLRCPFFVHVRLLEPKGADAEPATLALYAKSRFQRRNRFSYKCQLNTAAPRLRLPTTR